MKRRCSSVKGTAMVLPKDIITVFYCFYIPFESPPLNLNPMNEVDSSYCFIDSYDPGEILKLFREWHV